MAAWAGRQDGCVFLEVAQDLTDPATFNLLESWRDEAAVDAHDASDEFQAIMGEAASLKIVERVADVYSVSGAKQLDMAA